MSKTPKGLRLTTGASTQQGVMAERKLAFAVIRQALEDATGRDTRSHEKYGFRTARQMALSFLTGNNSDDVCVREFWAALAGCSGDQLRRAAIQKLGGEN